MKIGSMAKLLTKKKQSFQAVFLATEKFNHFEENQNFYFYGMFFQFIFRIYVIYIIWLAYLFLILAVTADEYFVPCLNWIAKALHLDENIAGVTFVALGNGAPDIFGALGIQYYFINSKFI